MKSHKCLACKQGSISWNSKEESYSCSNCSFEVPFDFNEKRPFVPFKKRHQLGSFIGPNKGKPSETDEQYDKLRILHKNISRDEEWKRRKEHFDEQVDKYRTVVKRYWRTESAEGISDYAKGDLIFRIANERCIPQTTICEILDQENLTKRSRYIMWEFVNTRKFGKRVEFLWKKFNCNKLAEKGERQKLSATIKTISDDVGLHPYLISKILINEGLYKFGNWAIWEAKRLEDYGQLIPQLWDSKKHKVKDDWDLCAVIDEISEIGQLNPYIILDSLAESKRVALNPKTAFTTYSEYKYAKLFLAEIKKHGPKTVPELSKKFGVGNRVANYAISLLYNRNILNRDRKTQCRDLVYFLPSQKKKLVKTNPYLKLEDIILNQSPSYLTTKASMLQNCSKSTIKTVLNYWVDQGEILKFSDIHPHMYVILNGSKVKSIQRALRDRFASLVTYIPAKGTTPKTLFDNIGGSNHTTYELLVKRLDLLKDYSILKETNNKIYLCK